MKITIIGAGSDEFTTELVTDFLATPVLESGTFALVDIDPERLETAHKMVEWLVAKSAQDWQIEATTDRTKVLAGSDYVINTIEVAGLANVRHDYDIPLKYGVDQCIGDTIGPGGLFKS
ncbi:MAG TPA: alpha-glucosidase/alpha-galactosidase, partial [Trueperaceae bacterium]|nr:alpha-glucosidase/alpha-galactosidase [Trueperaceae bacterium]